MKYNLRFVASSFALLLAVSARASTGVPTMHVMVSDASGNLVFEGSTAEDASFATTRLKPNRYVVQFNTRSGDAAGNDYLAVVSAGKNKVVATGVRGETFLRGGAAMRVTVDRAGQITGQLANERTFVGEKGARYRFVGGQRFVWVTAQLGTNLGGRWVEDGLAPAQNINNVAIESIHRIQEQAGEGNLINYYQRRHR